MKKLLILCLVALSSCLSMDASEEDVRRELGFLAGDADAIAVAFDTGNPDLAGQLRLLSDILEALSEEGVSEEGARAALLVLEEVLEKSQAVEDEELSAYVVVADMALRRLFARIRQ